MQRSKKKGISDLENKKKKEAERRQSLKEAYDQSPGKGGQTSSGKGSERGHEPTAVSVIEEEAPSVPSPEEVAHTARVLLQMRQDQEPEEIIELLKVLQSLLPLSLSLDRSGCPKTHPGTERRWLPMDSGPKQCNTPQIPSE